MAFPCSSLLPYSPSSPSGSAAGNWLPCCVSATRGRCGRSSTSFTTRSPRCREWPVPPSSSTAAGRSATGPARERRANWVLREHVLILSVETKPVPHVPAAERLAIDDLGCKDGRIIHVTEFFSYIDHANVPGLLPLIRKAGIESRLDRDKVSYLLSRIELRPGNTPGMGRWRKRLFPATRRITADAAEYFRLSRERTVIMGSRIEL